MSKNLKIIEALETALKASPNDIDLKLHLAEVCLDSDLEQKALAFFQEVLAADPINEKALSGAKAAAAALGDNYLVESYSVISRKLRELPDDHVVRTDIEPKEGVENSPKRVRGAKLKVVDTDFQVEFNDAEVLPESSNIYLKDVAGMDVVKKRLQVAFLGPIQNPRLMKAYGKNARGGLLLYGPPGCGKTFIARALAGELGAKFIVVGMVDILDMWFGQSERKLHEIFEMARRSAPVVMFFDELDALGQKRSNLRNNSAMRTLVNQLLAEMDSVGNSNENIFILGATNHPWDVDSALRRPGRFDRMIGVFLPDEAARLSIIKYNLSGKPFGKLDWDYLVARTKSFSGADLAHLCSSAVDYTMERAINTGKMQLVSNADFDQALSEIKPSTKGWFENAENYAHFANEGGIYDDLIFFMRENSI